MLTHAELVEIGYNWLIKKVRCSFALKELRSYADEEPDVIGWKSGDSILIECKTSRADFIADRKKLFRKNPRTGAGNYRFYLCPGGLIDDAELPDKWGLLWACPDGVVVPVYAPKGNVWTNFPRFDEINLDAERIMLCSALRRIQNKIDIQKLLYNE